MNTQQFYVVEVTRKVDNMIFMLIGYHSHDPMDTWQFEPLRQYNEMSLWSKLQTMTKLGDHQDHNKWLVDFVIPAMRQAAVSHPIHPDVTPQAVQSHLLTIYKVDLMASLNLRFKPMLCQTFHLSGEPFTGAIKQGYCNE
ncbi:hypothetical protein MZD04_gp376 [Pseudomonas phage Psa21]|uniref:Uncharacterized protein n=1 Tax=Pseudomonas phage Psa21 TaxID=2530023 RepID=A0A481W5B8_9CAUD|nr:hypothetical protein MZD04_gp376 [Pseudomonas phage Psa21]QBJ02902.1 hypothetical protein PSA21_376 [Pseudomonas phage Psa21]